MVDDDDFYRSLGWRQLQTKLLLHCCEKGWSDALARRR